MPYGIITLFATAARRRIFTADRPATSSLYGTIILPIIKATPESNSRMPIVLQLRVYTARRCCLSQGLPGIKLPATDLPETPAIRHGNVTHYQSYPGIKISVVVSLGVVFRKLNEFQQKLHPCVHTQLLINIVYRLFNGSFGYK